MCSSYDKEDMHRCCLIYPFHADALACAHFVHEMLFVNVNLMSTYENSWKEMRAPDVVMSKESLSCGCSFIWTSHA